MPQPEQNYTVSVATTHSPRHGTSATVSLKRRTGNDIGELLRHFYGADAEGSAGRYAAKLQRVADILNPSPAEAALRVAENALDLAQAALDDERERARAIKALETVREALGLL